MHLQKEMEKYLRTLKGNFTLASTSGSLTTSLLVSSSSIEVGGTGSSVAAVSMSSLV